MERLCQYPSLEEMYSKARGRVGDVSKIWATDSVWHTDRLEYSRAIVLGGTWSPAYLSDSGSHRAWEFSMSSCRILPVETVTCVADWVPFLEAVVKAKESLLIITNKVEENGEVMSMFLINTLRDVVKCCPVHPGNVPLVSLTPKGMLISNELLRKEPDSLRKSLLLCKDVRTRRHNSVLFLPEASDVMKNWAQEIAMIYVGGDYQESNGSARER